MDKPTIKTNNVPRDILYWYDLSTKERKEFDYLDTESRQDDASFMRYKGWVYDLGEFMATPDGATMRLDWPEFATWDGYQSDSYFSGILVRYTCDYEQIIAATYFV